MSNEDEMHINFSLSVCLLHFLNLCRYGIFKCDCKIPNPKQCGSFGHYSATIPRILTILRHLTCCFLHTLYSRSTYSDAGLDWLKVTAKMPQKSEVQSEFVLCRCHLVWRFVIKCDDRAFLSAA